MGRWRSVACLAGLALVVATHPLPANAQTGADAQHWELSGAYTYLREPRTDLVLPRGWMAGLARRIGPIWATLEVDRSAATLPLLVGDATMSMSSVMAGARVGTRIGPLREFAELQVGRARAHGVLFGVESSESRFAVQPGLGLEYPMGSGLAARLRLDARGVSSQDGSWIYQLRTAAGLAYSFR